ncbi:MAG: hypothetical protein L0241_10630 [Planctomycetia bacterium]|nr:hypothetical protein [Planctomycetia bacterium]
MIHVPPAPPIITISDPDTIRAAIDAADERARLLRRLLRLALRLQLHLTTGNALTPPTDRKGMANAR